MESYNIRGLTQPEKKELESVLTRIRERNRRQQEEEAKWRAQWKALNAPQPLKKGDIVCLNREEHLLYPISSRLPPGTGLVVDSIQPRAQRIWTVPPSREWANDLARRYWYFEGADLLKLTRTPF